MTTETTQTTATVETTVQKPQLPAEIAAKLREAQVSEPAIEVLAAEGLNTEAALREVTKEDLASVKINLGDRNKIKATYPAQALQTQMTVEVGASASMAQGTQEVVNPWDDIELDGDRLMEAYAGSRLEREYVELLPAVGQVLSIMALEKSGARAAIISIAQLMNDGGSAVEVPFEIEDKIFTWWRKIINRNDSIALPEERARTLERVENLVPPDLDEMMQAAGKFGTSKSALAAIGQGATFDIASVPWSLTDLALQMPDVLIQAAKDLRRSNLRQYFRLMMTEYNDYIFPILESPGFQSLCRIMPDMQNPQNTVGRALEVTGYPLAQAAFGWRNEIIKIWKFMPTMPRNDDAAEQWVMSLGKRSRAALAAAARVNRIIEQMERRGGISVAPANEERFRSAQDYVRSVAAPAVPSGLRIFGFNLSVSASVTISKS